MENLEKLGIQENATILSEQNFNPDKRHTISTSKIYKPEKQVW